MPCFKISSRFYALLMEFYQVTGARKGQDSLQYIFNVQRLPVNVELMRHFKEVLVLKEHVLTR